MANKIKYGLSNVYYSIITYGENDAITYGAPVRIPGGVNLSLSAEGDTNTFYADDVAYFTSATNNGYSGDLEVALIPDSFKTDVLGETLEQSSGVYYEYSNATQKEFALLFEFQGDESATRHCMYRCTASRPDVASATKAESIEPQTETLSITAMPRIADKLTKAKCPAGASAYNNWFTAVTEPTA